MFVCDSPCKSTGLDIWNFAIFFYGTLILPLPPLVNVNMGSSGRWIKKMPSKSEKILLVIQWNRIWFPDRRYIHVWVGLTFSVHGHFGVTLVHVFKIACNFKWAAHRGKHFEILNKEPCTGNGYHSAYCQKNERSLRFSYTFNNPTVRWSCWAFFQDVTWHLTLDFALIWPWHSFLVDSV